MFSSLKLSNLRARSKHNANSGCSSSQQDVAPSTVLTSKPPRTPLPPNRRSSKCKYQSLPSRCSDLLCHSLFICNNTLCGLFYVSVRGLFHEIWGSQSRADITACSQSTRCHAPEDGNLKTPLWGKSMNHKGLKTRCSRRLNTKMCNLGSNRLCVFYGTVGSLLSFSNKEGNKQMTIESNNLFIKYQYCYIFRPREVIINLALEH